VLIDREAALGFVAYTLATVPYSDGKLKDLTT
jgi:hypothetical protein